MRTPAPATATATTTAASGAAATTAASGAAACRFDLPVRHQRILRTFGYQLHPEDGERPLLPTRLDAQRVLLRSVKSGDELRLRPCRGLLPSGPSGWLRAGRYHHMRDATDASATSTTAASATSGAASRLRVRCHRILPGIRHQLFGQSEDWRHLLPTGIRAESIWLC